MIELRQKLRSEMPSAQELEATAYMQSLSSSAWLELAVDIHDMPVTPARNAKLVWALKSRVMCCALEHRQCAQMQKAQALFFLPAFTQDAPLTVEAVSTVYAWGSNSSNALGFSDGGERKTPYRLVSHIRRA